MLGGGDKVSPASAPRLPRSLLTLITFAVLATAGIMLLVTLSVWQFERRVWKLELITQVHERVHADPITAPGPQDWSKINAHDDAYRHIHLRGYFLNNREVLVQASTDRGVGFWVMTPLQTDHGFVVMVNRGFVSQDYPRSASHITNQISGDTDVTGLLRMTEPKGRIFRANNPGHNQWYSRDVAAMADALNISNVAPYFVDGDATPSADQYPIGGLTVVSFPNNHLIYAFTWLGLALMVAAGTFMVAREEYRLRLHK